MTKSMYQVEVRWSHKRDGPQRWQCRQTATSIRRAMNGGVEAFFTAQRDSARRARKKDYLDAHKHIRVEAWRLT